MPALAGMEAPPAPKRRKTIAGLPLQESIQFQNPELALANEHGTALPDHPKLVSTDTDVGGASSATDLLRKQLAVLDRLYGVYKVEYHAVLEELHAKHKDFKQAGGTALRADEGSLQDATAATAGLPSSSLRTLLHKGLQPCKVGGHPSDISGAAGDAWLVPAAEAGAAQAVTSTPARTAAAASQDAHMTDADDMARAASQQAGETGTAGGDSDRGTVVGSLGQWAGAAVGGGSTGAGGVHGTPQSVNRPSHLPSNPAQPTASQQTIIKPKAEDDVTLAVLQAADSPAAAAGAAGTPVGVAALRTGGLPGHTNVTMTGTAAGAASSGLASGARRNHNLNSSRGIAGGRQGPQHTNHHQRPFGGTQYGDPILGYGSDSEPEPFSDAEEIILHGAVVEEDDSAGADGEGLERIGSGSPGAGLGGGPATAPAVGSAGSGALGPAHSQALPTIAEVPAETGDSDAAGNQQLVEGKATAGEAGGSARYTVLREAPSPAQVAAWRARFAAALPEVVQLEALASACTEQDLEAEGALACLSGRSGRYLIKRNSVLLGRSTEGKGEVDVELGLEGPADKVSRRQAYLSLSPEGGFIVTNAGRRTLHVDGRLLSQFETAPIRHLSLLEVAGLQLLFMVNTAAVERVHRRTARGAAL